MKNFVMSGIQQIGVGVSNVYKAWQWYKEVFGLDIRIFEENSVAKFMLRYTGGKPQKRHAVLAVNLQGGGGFEIWQYTERTPQPPTFAIQAGDLGIFAAKMKCKNVRATFDHYREKGIDIVGSQRDDPQGNPSFFIRDPYNNLFQLTEEIVWFKDEKKPTGGCGGACIGVSSIEKALFLYKDILGYDTIIYDASANIFPDLADLPGGSHKMRRVLLKPSKPRKGPFSPILGQSQIELFQVFNRTPEKIFKDRFWGDLGFIHLCFDIQGIDSLCKDCKEKGLPFTVDTKIPYDMGGAVGIWSYLEDPDGTLIEFVETHKIPIFKKIGWYKNLQKSDPEKPLPGWMLKALAFNRVKKIPDLAETQQ